METKESFNDVQITDIVCKRIKESVEVKQKILADSYLVEKICSAGLIVRETISNGNKIMLCGNGGSASDSIHIAAEFVGRFQKERKSIPAIALNADMAAVTSIANDYGYEHIFERSVEGYGKNGDVLIGISTSGNSNNVLLAIRKAKSLGIKTVSFTGKDGGIISRESDLSIVVPSDCTARIQESHIMIGHIICELAEL